MMRRRTETAFSLLELIAVIMVIGILAALVLPMLLKNVDKAVGDQESATLQNFGDALQRSILRTRTVPLYAWDSAVAAELGLSASDVNMNVRRQPRCLMFDPGISTMMTLPYSQTNVLGLTSLTPNARAILVSSLGTTPFPAGVSNGVVSGATFSNVWNWVDNPDTPPAGWSSWAGRGGDLKVQRIGLSSLFVKLVLTGYSSTANAYYAIDSFTNVTAISSNYWLDGYFLQNSVLKLFSTDLATLDSQLVLNRDMGLVYYQNAWRGGITGGTNTLGTSTNNGGLMDFSAIVTAFLASPQNAASGAARQDQVVQAFIDYMNSYNQWAAGNFTNGALLTTTKNARQTMLDALNHLYANPLPPEY